MHARIPSGESGRSTESQRRRRESQRTRRGSLLRGGAAGAAAGIAAGAVLLAAAAAAVAHRDGVAADAPPGALIEATHVPALLTAPGEPATLRYDVFCPAPDGDPESGAPCDASGTVYVRAARGGAFTSVPLRLDPAATTGRYAADVPPLIARAAGGFVYYATVRNDATGATLTLPAGGESAPERSMPLGSAVDVALGRHAFGAPRTPDARVATATWGAGTGQVGLEPGPQVTPIGGSSFDVDAGGRVTILDEANRRLLRFAPGAPASATPVSVRGTIADLALDGTGGSYVLETVGDGGAKPLVRSFDANGGQRAAWSIAGTTASALRMSPTGPIALEYPAGQWMALTSRGAQIGGAAQERGGLVGRPAGGGVQIVAQREGAEARVALVTSAGVKRSWRITSDSPLGEIQLATPLGADRVLVVLRVYDDTHGEFEALILDPSGLVRAFSIDAASWAEVAPLAHFRVQGSSLYRLGSSRTGVFVDRFDLEVS